jgi:RimJ/RimL family protein N-acetyltransferase
MRYVHVRTERLRLDAVSPGDLDGVHELHADPEVWRHLPAGRHDSRTGTAAFIAQIEGDWAAEGLGYWAVRHGGRPGAGPASGALLGVCGCAVRHHAVWNLYYRFCPAAQGHGFAAETVAAARAAAADLRPGLPVVASLLEHNRGSGATAGRAGLELAWRGPDPGNPDATAIRLIYADRPLAGDLIQTLTRHA